LVIEREDTALARASNRQTDWLAVANLFASELPRIKDVSVEAEEPPCYALCKQLPNNHLGAGYICNFKCVNKFSFVILFSYEL
jgi:hypothetical protein